MYFFMVPEIRFGYTSFYYLFQKKSESNNLIKHEFSSYFLKHCCIYRFINAVCWLFRCEQDESPVEFLARVSN